MGVWRGLLLIWYRNNNNAVKCSAFMFCWVVGYAFTIDYLLSVAYILSYTEAIGNSGNCYPDWWASQNLGIET